MKLVNKEVKEYLKVLKSEAPAPGGGAVCALAGAQGAALVMMVANLTIGKKKYAEYNALCVETREKTEEVYQKLVDGIDEDKTAFEKVSAAYGMPKDTDELKQKRTKAIASASIEAAETPLEAMELSLQGLKLTQALLGKSNANLISDLGVAAVNFYSAISGAEMNVLINLSSIKDKEKAEYLSRRSKEILREGKELSDKIYNIVREKLYVE